MRQHSITRSILLAAACAMVAATGASAQTLVGDTVSWWSQPQLTGVAELRDIAVVTTPAHEFESVIIVDPVSTINVEATSIRLDALSNWYSPYFDTGFAPSYFEIRGLNFVGEPERYISGVEVSFATTISVESGSPANWPNYSAANVSFTADSVRISIGGYEFVQGSYVQVNLLTAVPAPGAAAVFGLAGLVTTRRRR